MTALQEDVDFLAHYGVKGQKWGVRRERISTRAPKSSKKQKAKTAAKFIGGSAVVVGAAAVALTMKKNGKSVKVSSLLKHKSTTRGKPMFDDIIKTTKMMDDMFGPSKPRPPKTLYDSLFEAIPMPPVKSKPTANQTALLTRAYRANQRATDPNVARQFAELSAWADRL